MTDIAERLRSSVIRGPDHRTAELAEEAVAEIERLRTALKEIASIAQKALEKKP